MTYNSNKIINDLEAKTTPVDADQVVLGDTADTNRAKKLTWANIKATLKAYFDTIYTNGTGTTDEIAYWSDSDTVGSLSTATYPSKTELSYVKGVTSAIQTQLNAKEGTITTLGVSKGGTGAGTLTAHGVVIGNGTSAVNITGAGTTGQVLTSNGASADPTFQTLSTGTFLSSGNPNTGNTSSNAENTVLTYSLAGGILSTNKGVRIRIIATQANTGVNSDATFRIKYGGTTLATFGTTGTTGTPTYTATFVSDLIIFGSGATGTQVSGGITTQNGTTFSPVATAHNGSSSIDSTSSQNIIVTIQHSSTSANITSTLVSYIIDKII